jgi:hypothetical protein
MPAVRAGRLRTAARLGRLFACGVAAAIVWACGPVYIPVPPPSQISFASELVTDPSGTRTAWTASGAPNGNASNALFYIFDKAQNAGVIAAARPDGSFQSTPMNGTAGDQVTVYYQDEHGRDSDTACLVLSTLPVADRCP